MKHVVFILIVLAAHAACGQTQGVALIDSLLKKLPAAGSDTDKLNILDELSFNYNSIAPDEGIRYGNIQLDLAAKLQLQERIGVAYMNIGVNYRQKSSYAMAINYFNKALAIFTALKDTEKIAVTFSQLGVVNEAQCNYPEALEFHLKALTIDEKLDRKNCIAGDFGNIGNIYMSMTDYNKALEYSRKSLAIFQELNDQQGIASNLGNIANAYDALGDHEHALQEDFKALKIFDTLGDQYGIENTLGNIATVYEAEHRYAIALSYDFKALEICRAQGDKSGEAIVTGAIGEAYDLAATDSDNSITDTLYAHGKRANLEKAAAYVSSAIPMCKQLGLLTNAMNLTQVLSYIYRHMGNDHLALESFTEYAALRDSVYDKENRVKVADLETRRELELKDKQIQIDKLELLKRRNEKILFLAGITLLLGVIGFGGKKLIQQIRFNNQISIEKKKYLARIEAQTNVLRDIANIQSHEVRGPVATILGLTDLFNTEDPSDPNNKMVIRGITEVSKKLDRAIKDVVEKENNVSL